MQAHPPSRILQSSKKVEIYFLCNFLKYIFEKNISRADLLHWGDLNLPSFGFDHGYFNSGAACIRAPQVTSYQISGRPIVRKVNDGTYQPTSSAR